MTEKRDQAVDMNSSSDEALISSRMIHDGRIVKLSLDTVRFPDGSTGELEVIRHQGAAAILPILGSGDEEDPEILLIYQYRYPTGGYLYEVPAGIGDREGESWEECAARELEEETGYRAGRLEFLTRFFTTPGFTDEVLHLYRATELGDGSVHRDSDEFLEVQVHRLSRALEMVRSGDIRDGKTIVALLFTALLLQPDR